MKKKLVLAIVMTAAMMFTACANMPLPGLDILQGDNTGSSGEETDRSSGNRLGGIDTDKSSGETPEAADDEDETPETVEGTDAGDEADSQQAVGDYARGITTDAGWESEFWNLRFTAPEGLFMLNEEGLNMMMGLSEDALSENYDERQLEYMKMTSVYEMVSMTQAGDANVVSTTEKLIMRNIKTSDYADAAITQLDTLYGSQYTLLEGEETVELGGETYQVIKCAVEGEAPYYQDCYVRVKGDRAISIIITYQDTTKELAETILGGFGEY